MNHLFLFLRRVLIVFLVGTFISVSTFTGQAVAQNDLLDECLVVPDNAELPRAAFSNPIFVDADENPILLDATLGSFDLQVNEDETQSYDGYLYQATYDDGSGDPVSAYTPPVITVSVPEPSQAIDPRSLDGTPYSLIDLTLRNNLPVRVQLPGEIPQTKENLENQSQYTNIHYHGFNMSPLLGGDDVLVEVHSNVTPKPKEVQQTDSFNISGTDTDTVNISSTDNSQSYKLIPVPPLGETTPDSSTGTEADLPGGYYPGDNPADSTYGSIADYEMGVKIPKVHQSGLFWYHSHAHSLSDTQVLAGLSGGMIIKGSNYYYSILDPTNGIQPDPDQEIDPEPEQFSVRQKVMLFKQFTNVLGTEGKRCFTLNDQVKPQITIKPGEVQFWRLANIGADHYLNIALETIDDVTGEPIFVEPNGHPNFYILARDADFVKQPVATNSVLLPPGSRVEVLVVGGEPDSTYSLVSDFQTDLVTDDDYEWTGAPGANRNYVLATVNVGSEADKVCYETADEAPLSLGTICPDGATSLDDHILSQEAFESDKLLPTPETLANLSECGSPGTKISDLLKTYRKRVGIKGKNDEKTQQLKKLAKKHHISLKYLSKLLDNSLCITPGDAYSDPLSQKRYFYLSSDGSKFFLTAFNEDQGMYPSNQIGDVYNGNRIDKISAVGDIEEWHLVNATNAAHVFHIHQLDFLVPEVILPEDPCSGLLPGTDICTYNNYRIVAQDNDLQFCQSGVDLPDGTSDGYRCQLETQGYRDVINLPGNSITTIRIPFVNPFITGIFVYHCHILIHEDRGMMHNLKVANPKSYLLEDMEEVHEASEILKDIFY
ncbi:multicopper oxidase domain-containing protein [Moorena sp. SIO3H5]|uniref:multicopper oxidase domain-containing protein n=1 Tax=Moorena sp. SIO3H5 TaxID=2607834 RepID=UPI0013BDF742|nr:multicopper oxidase domain-containing protein [Moorena sp. SIO3H5]NEO70516.1 multicopper oxidase domain-containing protein [Moorena sp. SIO3H5]